MGRRHARHRRHQLPRLRRPRIRPHPRPAHLPPPSRRPLRRLTPPRPNSAPIRVDSHADLPPRLRSAGILAGLLLFPSLAFVAPASLPASFLSLLMHFVAPSLCCLTTYLNAPVTAAK